MEHSMPHIIAAQNDIKSRALSGRMVLLWFIMFFATIFAVNGIMMRFAYNSFSGIDADNAYRTGLQFTQDVNAANAQDALGWTVSAAIAPDSGGRHRIDVRATDGANKVPDDTRAIVRLIHPANRRFDRVIAMAASGPGQFSGFTDAAPGQWDVNIELYSGERRTFLSHNRFTLDPAIP